MRKQFARAMASLLAVAVAGTLVGCNPKDPQPETEPTTEEQLTQVVAPPATETTEATEPSTTEPTSTTTELSTSITLPTTAPTTGGTTTTGTTKTTKATTTATTTATTKTTKATTTGTTKPKELSKEDALKLFNDAVKKVVNGKAGYQKTRTTTIQNLDFGPLGGLQVVKDAVNKFVGAGTNTFSASKGTSSDLMRVSTLTLDDLNDITITPNGDGYTVDLKVKDGGTSWSGGGKKDGGSGSSGTYVDKGPLCIGQNEDSKYDHKVAQNIYAAINKDKDAETKSVAESVNNVSFSAQIDKDGRLTQLKAHLGIRVDIHNVRYTIITLNNKNGTGVTDVTYSDFKY